MMHDRGRSLHDWKRRKLIEELLEQMHTAISPYQSEGSVQTPLWASVHCPKHISSNKNFPLSFQIETIGTRDNLPQETSKTLRYEQQPLKAVTKRKRKMGSGRLRDPDRRKDRGSALHMQRDH